MKKLLKFFKCKIRKSINFEIKSNQNVIKNFKVKSKHLK